MITRASLGLSLLMLGCSGDSTDRSAKTPEQSPSIGTSSIQLVRPRGDAGLAMVDITTGEDPATTIVEVKGTGLGVLDADGDGDLDLVVPNGSTLDAPTRGPGAIYLRNLLMENGRLEFEDATDGSGLENHRDWSFGVAAGDVDGDGHQDLVMATLGRDRLWLGGGDGTFEDATDRWGLGEQAGWTAAAGLGDLDGDGDLDLITVGYLDFDPFNPPGTSTFRGREVLSGPRGLKPRPDRWFENLGDRFEPREVPSVDRYGLNLVIVDFDGDGRQDVIVGNDSHPNQYHRNLGDWKFQEMAVRTGVATNREGDAQATMGMAIADVDEDGSPDLFSTNFSSDTNTLHVNRDDFFDDRTRPMGLAEGSRQMLGWATEFVDFDHDGDEDVLVVNGHVYPQATLESMDSSHAQAPGLWVREGDRFQFIDPTDPARSSMVEANPWLTDPHHDRAAVFADLDQDGDIDVVVAERNGSLRLLENRHDGEDDWLVVRPVPALGAEVVIETPRGIQRRWIRGGGPFQSNVPPEAHFGLGSLEKGPIQIRVRWPDGSTAQATSSPGEHVRIVRP